MNTYRQTVKDPQMHLFYSIIMNERSINGAAADIMVRETRTMINATKTLFYALQVKGIASFENADAAAFSFAMAVHSIIDYEFDLDRAHVGDDGEYRLLGKRGHLLLDGFLPRCRFRGGGGILGRQQGGEFLFQLRFLGRLVTVASQEQRCGGGAARNGPRS